MHRILATVTIAFLLIGVINSCAQHYPTQPTKCDTCSDTTHYPCDTCNLNQDSLQRVKDSLSHAWVWTEYSIPGESNLTGVWVFSDTNILIVGNNLWKYNGSTFTKLNPKNFTHGTPMNGGLNGFSIFALSPLDYWMVYSAIAFHTEDGINFDDYRPGATNAAWGPSSNDIFVVGNGGQIHHFDGTKFTDMASPTAKDLKSVWGTSHNDVWACGFNSSKGESVLIHFDGQSWTEDVFSVTGRARDWGIGTVWTVDSASHKIAIIAGSSVFRKEDNGQWAGVDSDHVGNKLGAGGYIGIGAYGNAPNDFMAIGGWGFVSHWNGKTWKQFTSLYDYNNSFYGPAAFSMNGNTVCIVGVKSGNSWVAIGRRGRCS